MTDNIPELIERLNQRAEADVGMATPTQELCREAAEALSRLTVSPLPEEIADLKTAELIVEARRLVKDPDVDVELSPFLMAVAFALERMARENESLRQTASVEVDVALPSALAPTQTHVDHADTYNDRI